MLNKLILFLLVLFLGVASAYGGQLVVSDAAITTGIVNQMPVDRQAAFPADYGKLYCFTRISGAVGDTMITHVWYYQEQEMARVSLSVRSSDWRTYSSKRFLPQWSGQWRVAVLDGDMNEIDSIPFELK